MAYTDLADALIAENRVLTPGVASIMRDNIDALYEDTHGFAYKTADETLNNDNTLQDDNHLQFAVGANEVWHVRGRLIYDTGVAADFKYQLTTPSSGATGLVTTRVYQDPISVVTGFAGEVDSPVVCAYNLQTDCALWFDALVTTGATAGTFKLQWAQNTSDAANTTVQQGSFMVGQRLDDVSGSVSYTEITDADIDDESPGKTGLAEKFRDNPIALYEDTRAYAVKAADETVNNDTVLQDDDDLAFAIGTNEEWRFSLCLAVETLATADLKIQMTGPAAAVGYIYEHHEYATGGVLTSNAGTAALGAPLAILYAVNLTDAILCVEGYIRTAGTGGTCKLEWAQNAAIVTDTKLLENSFLVAHRLDSISGGLGSSYSTIADSQIDPESGVIETLFAELRDNAVALYNDTRAFAYKAGDEAVTNDTTLQDDDDLSFSIGANEQWCFSLVLHVSAHDDGNLKIQITTPDGGDVGYVAGMYDEGTAASHPILMVEGLVNAPIVVDIVTTTLSSVCLVEGFVSTGGTSGTVQLEWAQSAAHATSTKLLTGSYLIARRMDDV